MFNISYQRLASAITYYTGIGYEYIEVPWAVPRSAIEVTCTNPDLMLKAYPLPTILVGSAEQSFIALDAVGELDRGRYIGCSPCFRPGDEDGLFRQNMFMKVELYRTDHVDHHAINEMVMEAMEFFSQQLASTEYALYRAQEQRDCCDIELNGVEIGSYGIRQHDKRNWVYGTAIAEPRFSMAAARDPRRIAACAEMFGGFDV